MVVGVLLAWSHSEPAAAIDCVRTQWLFVLSFAELCRLILMESFCSLRGLNSSLSGWNLKARRCVSSLSQCCCCSPRGQNRVFIAEGEVVIIPPFLVPVGDELSINKACTLQQACHPLLTRASGAATATPHRQPDPTPVLSIDRNDSTPMRPGLAYRVASALHDAAAAQCSMCVLPVPRAGGRSGGSILHPRCNGAEGTQAMATDQACV